jgi:1,4-alpha-glucan branching enzyme
MKSWGVGRVGQNRPVLAVVLHSHLPWVMGCGRWPFGEEWVYEIALNCYMPLVRCFQSLARDGIPANVTVSITPVLGQQLASDAFKRGFVDYLEDRVRRVGDDRTAFLAEGRTELARLAFWMEDQVKLALSEFEAMGYDLPGAFAGLARAGAIELATSAATHGYLPLLRHSKSRRLQVRMGRIMFTEIFGVEPRGFWFPECAYRPGLEELVTDEGYDYTVLDAMAIQGGRAMSHYGESTRVEPSTGRPADRLYMCRDSRLVIFPRHPELCAQVWSKWTGYPGDFAYREFHKQNPRSGMRYHRVTDSAGDLNAKQPYDPATAKARAREHAAHFVAQVEAAAAKSHAQSPVFTAAFDTELYGHWWFEGPIFLEEVSRLMHQSANVELATCSQILADLGAGLASLERIEPLESSWGVNCDHSVWMNERTKPMWEKIWELEDVVNGSWVLTPFGPWPGDLWDLQGHVDEFLREFLLMMASDWEFLMYTGTAGDYPERRFEGHRRRCAEAYARLQRILSDEDLPAYTYEPSELAEPAEPVESGQEDSESTGNCE